MIDALELKTSCKCGRKIAISTKKGNQNTNCDLSSKYIMEGFVIESVPRTIIKIFKGFMNSLIQSFLDIARNRDFPRYSDFLPAERLQFKLKETSRINHFLLTVPSKPRSAESQFLQIKHKIIPGIRNIGASSKNSLNFSASKVAEEIKSFKSGRNLVISLINPNKISVCSVLSWASSIIITE